MSPERMMLDAFGEVGFAATAVRGRRYHRGWMLWLFSQVQLGQYRPDFLVVAGPAGASEPTLKLMVEIDGPEHDARRNSANDRLRDRFFTLDGWRVIRFTNAEVMSDAVECAINVLKLAIAIREPELDAEFTAQLERSAGERA